LGGVLTSLALGTPPIASGLAHMMGLGASNTAIDVLVIALWTFVPLATIVFGLKKGVARLSNINVYGFILLLFLLVAFGPTWFIFNQSTDGLGLMIQNFFYMSLNTDPIGNGGFPQAWPVFYMSWWAVYALPFGLFIAKISKGRTIRQLVAGGLLSGSLGCIIFYMVLPSFGMNLQRSGTVDLVKSLAEKGRGGVVIDMLGNAPGGFLMIILFTLICLLSYITGHVSVGYSLAASAEKKLRGDQDPQVWNVTFWLILAGVVSLGLYLLNRSALAPLQTVSILTGFPICIAMTVMIVAFFRQLKKDFPNGIPLRTTSAEKIYGTPESEE
jgi:BCCT family betaine/carnitine transporter